MVNLFPLRTHNFMARIGKPNWIVGATRVCAAHVRRCCAQVRGRNVQPNDISELALNSGSFDTLKASLPMRVEAVGTPNALHRGVAHAHTLGQRSSAPMGGGLGLIWCAKCVKRAHQRATRCRVVSVARVTTSSHQPSPDNNTMRALGLPNRCRCTVGLTHQNAPRRLINTHPPPPLTQCPLRFKTMSL